MNEGAPRHGPSNEKKLKPLDFTKCETASDLFDLVAHMEQEGLRLGGSSGTYGADDVRKSIAEVRSYRAQANAAEAKGDASGAAELRDLAQGTLARITSTAGLRQAVDRIIQGGKESWG